MLTELRTHVDDVREYVSECVQQYGPNLKVLKADLILTGDQDIGTLVDASGVVAGDGSAVTAKLDDCIRSQLQTLVLPPINTGDAFSVNYEFVFN